MLLIIYKYIDLYVYIYYYSYCVYIDLDYILIHTSSCKGKFRIMTKLNNMDVNIRLTMEHPDDTGSLSMVDFQLKIMEVRSTPSPKR